RYHGWDGDLRRQLAANERNWRAAPPSLQDEKIRSGITLRIDAAGESRGEPKAAYESRLKEGQETWKDVDAIGLRNHATQLATARGEVIDAGAHDAIRQGLVEIAHRTGHFGVGSGDQIPGVAGDDRREAVVLVIVRFGVLVDVEQAAVIEQSAVAFGH